MTTQVHPKIFLLQSFSEQHKNKKIGLQPVVEHSQGPFDRVFYSVDRNAQLLGHQFVGFAFVSTEDKHAPAVVGQRGDSFLDFLLQFFLQQGVERIGC